MASAKYWEDNYEHLAVDSERDQHEEEQRRPELWRFQIRHDFRVGNERQTSSCISNQQTKR